MAALKRGQTIEFIKQQARADTIAGEEIIMHTDQDTGRETLG